MSDGLLQDLLDEGFTWPYRGVPTSSREVADALADGEIRPRDSSRRGDRWRQVHSAGDTSTAYTSWTSDRALAWEAAASMCELEDLDERVTILRVRIDSLDERRLFQGRDDEYEYLIEGTVEGVDFSNDAAEDDDG